MVNNNSNEFTEKLSKLSERERQILMLRCDGLDYKSIGGKLFVTISTVKQYMSRVYIKLGLDLLPRAERMKGLYEIYCPLLKKIEAEPVIVETETKEVVTGVPVPETSEPISPDIEKMLDEDEYPLVPFKPAPKAPLVVQIPPHGTTPSPRRLLWLIWLVGGVVLGICLGAGVAYLFLRPGNGPNPFIPQPTSTLSPPTVIASEISLPSPTLEFPTQTPVVVTQVVVVTATPPPSTEIPTSLPTAAISLPFTDNFDNGASPSWQPVTSQGTWRVINGRYTETGETAFLWSYSLVGDPNWQDYTVDVDYSLEIDNAAGLAVIVRAGGQSNLGLAFVFNNYQASWRIWQDGQWQKLVTSDGGPAMQGHIKIQVKGSTFTASAIGMSPLVITDTSTSGGMVGLGVYCRAPDECPLFDNFSVK